VTPEEARDLRHELRTPVNHLIGYAELLLEEDGLTPAVSQTLEAIRDRAKTVLGLVPQILADDGSIAAGARTLGDEARALASASEQLRSAPSRLSTADLDRLVSAAGRLGELSGRLVAGSIAVDRDTGAVQAPRPGGPETILVVDDDEANRELLGRRLQRLGYGVVEARDGIEALEMMSRGGIDLVLLDAMMPRLDGYGVLERRRTEEALLEVPVIMISALDQMDAIVRGIELGAEDYLPKPFDPVLLKARISSSLEKKRRRAAELSYLADVAVITHAADRFESGSAETGELDVVAQRPDELGRLAQVLIRVAREAREREQALREQIRQRGYAFISYASADRDRVEPIVDRLTEAGINVWMDRNDIRAGSHWAAEIVQSIRGCSALLVACSAAAFESRNVRQEIQVGGKYNRPYVPLILERVPFPDEVEYQLEGWQWIDVLDRPAENWLPPLIEALAQHHVVPLGD
jgi:DNA-binding response OmpR family regulator